MAFTRDRSTQRMFTACSGTDSNVGAAGDQLCGSATVADCAGVRSRSAQLVGEPIAVADHIALDSPSAPAAHLPSVPPASSRIEVPVPDSRLIWFDRTGKGNRAISRPAPIITTRGSPLMRSHLAVEKTDAVTGRHTIWNLDLVRGITSRLIYDPPARTAPRGRRTERASRSRRTV